MGIAKSVSWIIPRWPFRQDSATQQRANIAHDGEASDEQLFARVCANDLGDPASFDILVTRYRARIVALVRRMLTTQQSGIDAEDIAQEAFIDAFRKRHTFKHGAQLRPWLFGIAVNRCLDHLRSRNRESMVRVQSEQLEECALPENAASNDPADIVMSQTESDGLERGVASLPPNLRAVLILRYLDDMQYEEISEALKIPVGTVKTNLFRARAELRKRMTNASQS